MKKQKLYCNNCGILFIGVPQGGYFVRGIVCSTMCSEELQMKYSCYVMDKDYEEYKQEKLTCQK